MAKSCHPPSGIGARFATAEPLGSPRSYPAGIPSNSVAAPTVRMVSHRPHGHPCRPDGFFHSEAVFPKLREFGFFPRGYSHSARMDFHGWEKALEARLQRRYANLENDQKNTPGLVFLFF